MTTSLLPHHVCDVTGTFLDPRWTLGMCDILPQVCFYLHSEWETSSDIAPDVATASWKVSNSAVGLGCRLCVGWVNSFLHFNIWGDGHLFAIEVYPNYHFVCATRAGCTRTHRVEATGYNNDELRRDFCEQPAVATLDQDIRSLGATVRWTKPEWIQDIRKRLHAVLPRSRRDALAVQDLFSALVTEILGSHPTFFRWRFVTRFLTTLAATE